MTPGERPSVQRGRKLTVPAILSGLAVAVLAFVAFLALVVALAIFHLGLPAGRRVAREMTLRLVNSQIAGSIAIGRIEKLAPGVVVVRDARLMDPGGRPVVRVVRAAARIDLVALLDNRIRLTRLALRSPRVTLFEDPKGGLTLESALAARALGPAAGPGGGSRAPPLSLELDDVSIRGGTVGGRVGGVVLDLREIDSHLRLAVAGRVWVQVAWARSRVLAPVPGSAGAVLVASGTARIPDRFEVAARATWKDGILRARVARQGDDVAVQLWLPETAASTLRSVLPEYPLEGTLGAWIVATGTFSKLDVSIDLVASGATLAARGSLVPRGFVYDLGVALADLDPSLSFPDVTLQARLGYRGRMAGQGLDPDSFDIRFDGVIAPASLEGTRVPGGPARVNLGPRGLEVQRFAPRAQGLDAVVRGTLGWDGAIDARVNLEAARIAALPGLEDFRGSTSAALGVTGSVDGPFTFRGSATAIGLGIGPLSATRVDARFDVRLPLDRPSDLRVDVTARATETRVGAVLLGDAQIRALGGGALVRAVVSTAGADRRLAFDALVRPSIAEGRLDATVGSLEVGLSDRTFRGRISSVHLGPELYAVEELFLERADGARIGASASIEARGAWAVVVDSRSVDVGEIALLSTGRGFPLTGRADLHLVARGPLDALDLALEARLTGARYRSVQDVAVAVRASWVPGRLRADLRLDRARRLTVHAAGELPLRLTRDGHAVLEARGKRDLRVEIYDLPIEQLLGVLMDDPPEVAGSLSAAFRLTGTWSAPSGTLVASVEGGRAGQVGGLAVELAADYDPEGIRLDTSLSRNRRRVLAAKGTVGIVLEAAPDQIVPSRDETLVAPVALGFEIGPLDQGLVPDAVGTEPDLRIDVSGDGTIEGAIGDPILRGQLGVWGLEHPALHLRMPAEGEIRFEVSRREARITTARFTAGDGTLFEAALAVRLDLGDRPVPRLQGWRTVGPFEARLSVPGLDLSVFEPLENSPVSGQLVASVVLKGTSDRPVGSFEARATGVGLGRLCYESVALDAAFDDGSLEAGADLRQRGGGSLVGHARIPLRWDRAELALRYTGGTLRPPPDPPSLGRSQSGLARNEAPLHPSESAEVDATVALDAFLLDGLGFLSSEIDVLGGRVDGKVRLAGPSANPDVVGDLRWRSGSFQLATVGQRFEDIALKLRVSPGRLVIDELEARDRDGRIEVKGEATLSGLWPSSWRLHVRAKSFPAVHDALTVATLTGRLEIDGKADPDGLEMNIVPRRLAVTLPNRSAREVQPLDPHPDIEVYVGGRPVEERRLARPPERPFVITIRLRMRYDVWVKRNDLSIALDGSVVARIPSGGSASLEGSIHLRRGYLTTYGRRFDVDRGELTFTGEEAGVVALLDVDALYRHPEAEVRLHVGGSTRRPRLNLSAPGLTESETLALVILGSSEIGGRAESQSVAKAAGTEAAALVSSLGLSVAQESLREVLPGAVTLVVEPGTSGLASGRIRAGQQLSDRLYAEAEVNIGAASNENTYEVRTEYRISRRWDVESFYGDKGVAGIDLLWSYSY